MSFPKTKVPLVVLMPTMPVLINQKTNTQRPPPGLLLLSSNLCRAVLNVRHIPALRHNRHRRNLTAPVGAGELLAVVAAACGREDVCGQHSSVCELMRATMTS